MTSVLSTVLDFRACVSALALASALATPANAQDRHLLFAHPSIGFGQGYGIAPVGDIDADGHHDYAVARRVGASSSNVAVTAYSGYNGLQLWSTPEVRNTLGKWGQTTVAVDDRDGDGLREVMVGHKQFTVNGATNAGDASLYDGATGQLIHRFSRGAAGEFFGARIRQVGDIDNDGTRDYAIGGEQYPNGSKWGRVSIFSGATFAFLREWAGSGAPSLFSDAADMGDLDGDGFDDLALGAFGSGSADAYVRVMSTRFSFVMWEVRRTNDTLSAFVPVPDRNGDGFRDLVVSWHNAGSNRHDLVLYDGVNGAVLASGSANLLIGIDEYPDLDGDGFSDIGVGCDGGRGYPSGIYSGLTLALIQPLGNRDKGFVTLGDVDGDGRTDFATTAGTINAGTRVTVCAVDPMPLTVTPHEISVAVGGLAPYSLDAGPAHAGKVYFVVGSLSGFATGFPFLGQHIPLNLDAYTLFTANYPNLPILSPSFGTLDASGRATINFSVLPKPGLAGLTLHHSAVVFGPGFPGSLSIDFVSNARPVSTVP